MLKITYISKIFLLSFITLFAFGENLYTKDVGRIVSGIWTEIDNPFYVTSSLLIPSGKTLTIQEGVKIYFKKGKGIKVIGNLVINGTSTKKVIFSSKNKIKGAWYGIDIEKGATVEFKHCLIKYASTAIKVNNGVNNVVIENCIITEGGIETQSKSIITNCEIKGGISINDGDNNLIKNNIITDGGISIDEDSDDNLIEDNSIKAGINLNGIYTGYDATHYWNAPTSYYYSTGNKIRGNIITNCRNGIEISGGSSNIISNNVIKNNNDNGIDLGNGTVINNIIKGNKGYGIKITEAGKINNNEIYGNTKWELYNDGSSEIDATNNWWGTSDESIIITKIFDYFQKAEYGIVHFKPFLMKPPFTLNKAEILKIQKRLLELGYNVGLVDGLMGAKTKNAIKSFQKDNFLEANGNIDEKTKEKLFSITQKKNEQ